MAIIPKVSVKTNSALLNDFQLITAADSNEFAYNSPALLGSVSRAYLDGVGPLDIVGYEIEYFNGVSAPNFTDGVLVGTGLFPLCDGTDIYVAAPSVDDNTNTWVYGEGALGASLSTVQRILAAFPVGAMIGLPYISFENRNGGGALTVSLNDTGTAQLYLTEHDSVSSVIYNACEYDDLAQAQTMLGNTGGGIDLFSVMIFPNSFYDYTLAFADQASATIYLTGVTLEPFGGGFTADLFSVTLDDADLDLSAVVPMGALNDFFYFRVQNTLGENVIVAMTGNGDQYETLDVGTFDVTSYRNINGNTLTTNNEIYAGSQIGVSRVNALAVKDAISLPCYNPCRPLIIKKEI